MIGAKKIDFIKAAKSTTTGTVRVTKLVSVPADQGLTIADGDARYAKLSDVHNAVRSKQIVIGNGIDSALTVAHGLHTTEIVDVTFKRVSDGSSFAAGWTVASSDTIQVSIKPPPATQSVVASIQYLEP